MKYNKWTIVEKLKDGKCIAKCDCGTVKEQWSYNITSGKSTQCIHCQGRSYRGRGIHGDIGGIKHPLYNVWSGIKRRCYNPKQKSYKYYGAKGVTMCEEWLNDYRKFYDWMMANGYEKGMVVSRNEDKGNYEPSNCKVKTHSENSVEAEKYKFTKQEKHKLSMDRCGFTQEQFDSLLKDCLSGNYLSSEMVASYNIDRHTIIKILKRNGLKPLWRKGILVDSQVEDIRYRYSAGEKTKDLAVEYDITQESICCVVKKRGSYKDR